MAERARNPNLRQTAVEMFNREWAQAIEEGTALKGTYDRLARTLADLSEHGGKIMVEMPDDLLQEWWVTYCEAKGDMIPRHPLETPPAMKHEDEIVAEHSAQ